MNIYEDADGNQVIDANGTLVLSKNDFGFKITPSSRKVTYLNFSMKGVGSQKSIWQALRTCYDVFKFLRSPKQ